MFALDKAPAFISSFNPRAEKHGEDNKLAADIKVTVTRSNIDLDHFSKDLRNALYRKAAKGEQLDIIEGADSLVAVKFPRIGAVRWDEEYPGYELKIGSGLGLSDPLTICDVTLKKFLIEPKEGGSVIITFNVICHPDAEEAGLLCGLIQSDVEMTLIAPDALANAA